MLSTITSHLLWRHSFPRYANCKKLFHTDFPLNSATNSQKYVNLPLSGKVSIHSETPIRIDASEVNENCTQHTLTVKGAAEVIHFEDLNKFRISTKEACHISIPCQYDLKVRHHSNDGKVVVSSLVNRAIEIHSSSPVSLHKLKTHFLSVNSESEIHSDGLILAERILLSGQKNVQVSHVQGTEMKVQMDSGKINIRSVYLNECTVEGNHVDVHVGAGHGHFSCYIKEKGSLRCDSLEGGLEARVKYGNVDVHLSKPSAVDVDVAEGNISLSFDAADGKSFHSLLDFTTDVKGEIQLSSELPLDNRDFIEMGDANRYTGVMGEIDDPLCRARTHEGNINATCKSWAEQFVLSSRNI